MNDDLFRRDFSTRDSEPPVRDNLFIWTVFILLLIGMALACWLGSFYIFGHPEKPDSYRILQKLHKLDPPKRFELVQAPPGEFLTPQKAFEKYSNMSRFDLERENEALLRDYINNFQSTKRLVPYLTGRYSIMSSYELKSTDFFGSGVVALAQSVEYPQTLLEHVYTAGAQTIPVLDQMLAPGLDIKLEKTMDLSAVIHVARMFDGRLQFTVVPLLYGSYALKQGSGSFSLEPPPVLNPAGGLPIVRDQLLQDALKAYAEHLRKRPGSKANVLPGMTPAIPVAQSAAQTTIVRVEESPSPSPLPVPSATPALAVTETKEAASPIPQVTPETAPLAEVAPAKPTATPSLTKPFVSPTATPAIAAARPSPSVAVTPTPAPIASPAKVALQPFLVSSPTPGLTANSGGSWRTYAPGQMPRGRLVNLAETSDLAERGAGGERLYLRGSFVVTASGENRAVLRSSSTLGNALASVTKTPATRIIVEFPAGTQPPPERTSLSRDEQRPFEIRDIRRGNDGQINIYVREVTTP